MEKSSQLVEIWCIVEGIFFICLNLQIQYLQYLDPLEASLKSCACMMEADERKLLWSRILEAEEGEDLETSFFLCGWFCDEKTCLDNISRYDVMDFITWSMFEGRNQEHLTADESAQLDQFVDDLEWEISKRLYGTINIPNNNNTQADAQGGGGSSTKKKKKKRRDGHECVRGNQRVRQRFHFHESTHDEASSYFSNFYENYKVRYDQCKSMIENAEFNPMQDFRNFMAETRQQIAEVEVSAVATATHMAENAYNTLVSPGSNVDKQLSQIGYATQTQITEAWNSVKEMKERLKTAQFISSKRRAIQQQLEGYRELLHRMRPMSSALPTKHMAELMQKITQCNESMERIESSARDAFVKATGFGKNLLQRKEPKRYYKYSYDPLLGITTYPLMLHLLIYGITEGGLQVMMRRRGFHRLRVGPVNYYYHVGQSSQDDHDDEQDDVIPIVFCHGIGIGLIAYIPLIDELIKTGRPILLPELPFVSGFRPWQSPNSVLSPAVVSSTMTEMLTIHGFRRGTFVGHSYGTSWLSYMCKYAPHAVASLLFLDPICFCLHVPGLTKQFVYHRADPGTVSYLIRTDVMVNWTIQRRFPWAQIILFTDQIKVPCGIMLSECDALVPAKRVLNYLDAKGIPCKDFRMADRDYFCKNRLYTTVFLGDGHGAWTETPSATSHKIATAVDALCETSQQEQQQRRRQ